MYLSELIRGTSITLRGADTDVTDIGYNSRKVVPGSVFCCIVGLNFDGHNFAEQAVANGAAALLVERELPIDVPQLVTDDARKGMALISAAFFGHPEQKMRLVGVTGTNGKTTTTYMVKSIAEQAGMKVGIIGTIRNMIGTESLYTERTTPESVDLYRLLALMAERSVDLVVMEVSSHALDQNRVYGLPFAVGLFTNLTQDHLDYHKTFENYLQAKKKLFYASKQAVINADDPYSARISEGLGCPVTTFGVRDKADIAGSNIDITTRGVVFDLHTPSGDIRIDLPIPGLFSVFNAMGSVGAALALGLSLQQIKAGLEIMTSVSGRLESVPTGRDFSVFIDYAHTPDALENVLKTVREFAKARILCVFGCGGDRDRAKRPIMGEIGGRYSDFAIITSDNPRSEEPMSIIESIEEGIRRTGTHYTVIENRRDAIRYALVEAKADDIVLIAGKGHENYQEINGKRYHFDDKETVKELLAEME